MLYWKNTFDPASSGKKCALSHWMLLRTTLLNVKCKYKVTRELLIGCRNELNLGLSAYSLHQPIRHFLLLSVALLITHQVVDQVLKPQMVTETLIAVLLSRLTQFSPDFLFLFGSWFKTIANTQKQYQY